MPARRRNPAARGARTAVPWAARIRRSSGRAAGEGWRRAGRGSARGSGARRRRVGGARDDLTQIAARRSRSAGGRPPKSRAAASPLARTVARPRGRFDRIGAPVAGVAVADGPAVALQLVHDPDHRRLVEVGQGAERALPTSRPTSRPASNGPAAGRGSRPRRLPPDAQALFYYDTAMPVSPYASPTLLDTAGAGRRPVRHRLAPGGGAQGRPRPLRLRPRPRDQPVGARRHRPHQRPSAPARLARLR